MADGLISADALKREMWRRCGETDIEIDKGRAKWDSGLWIRYKVFEECIADAQTIEAKPTKHGRWKNVHISLVDPDGVSRYGRYGYQCSVCGAETANITPYCPNCGAKMDEVTE